MMRIPECLSRRYKALDDIIQELSLSLPSQNPLTEQRSNTSNVGIKLMCDFWNILKEDPDCNLTAEVQQRMGMRPGPELCPNVYGVQRYMTYMTEKCCTDKDSNHKGCKVNKSDQDADKDKHKCGKDDANVMSQGKTCCKRSNDAPKKQTEVDIKLSGACCSGTKATQMKDDGLALTKVLCNLKQAATFDKKCHVRVKELMEAQKTLKEQVQVLEAREKEGVKLLKEADCMWLCMEDAYKKKVAESQERQQLLLKQLKEIETSATKWRKNKKDLEFQINNMTKARMEIVEKMNQKKNDIKIMDSENQNLTKRIESAKKDLANSIKSMGTAKEASDTRMVNLTEEMVKIQKKTNEERTNMKKKENEGTQYVKEARTDLQNICKVLLQKKLENEDLRAERTAINEEMDLLVSTLGTCKDKCKNKEESVLAELKTLTNEIATFEAKCKKCHICTDTNDVRKLCTDCPKCLQERKCNVGEEDCTSDPTMDCVCMSVKQKFLDNVFDNMYTVLERQSRTQPGKALADAILNSLKRSTNGKLSPQTRRILQEFILSTVKKNLNLTIVGGAVKTRCEMDPETYKQLMTCLKSVKAVKPPQADKGTPPRKEPCKRWGPSSECNCPKGPKNCICTRKAPPHPDDPRPCPQDKEDIGEQKICPYKEKKVCGPDCGMQGRSSRATRDIGNEIATWRPDPCSGPSCPYNKITRAAMAQCVLGNESMVKTESRKSTCTCRTTPLKSCHCHRDRRRQLREKNIAEVMGRYHEVPPIAKVTCTGERYSDELIISRKNIVSDCSNLPRTYVFTMNKSAITILLSSTCSSVYMPLHDPDIFYSKVCQKRYPNNSEYFKGDNNSNITNNRNKNNNIRKYITCNNTATSYDDDVQVILYPKFAKHQEDEISVAFDTFDTILNGGRVRRPNVNTSVEIKNQDITLRETRDIESKVCKAVNKQMKKVILKSKCMLITNQLSLSVVEWVTVKELYEEIIKLMQSEYQDIDTIDKVLKSKSLDELNKKISLECTRTLSQI